MWADVRVRVLDASMTVAVAGDSLVPRGGQLRHRAEATREREGYCGSGGKEPNRAGGAGDD
jgi:hypothetical protein